MYGKELSGRVALLVAAAVAVMVTAVAVAAGLLSELTATTATGYHAVVVAMTTAWDNMSPQWKMISIAAPAVIVVWATASNFVAKAPARKRAELSSWEVHGDETHRSGPGRVVAAVMVAVIVFNTVTYTFGWSLGITVPVGDHQVPLSWGVLGVAGTMTLFGAGLRSLVGGTTKLVAWGVGITLMLLLAPILFWAPVRPF